MLHFISHCNLTLTSSPLHTFFMQTISVSPIMSSLGFQPTWKFFKYRVANECSRAELTPTVLSLIIVVGADNKKKKVELSRKKKAHLHLNLNSWHVKLKSFLLLFLGATFASLRRVISASSPSATLLSLCRPSPRTYGSDILKPGSRYWRVFQVILVWPGSQARVQAAIFFFLSYCLN